jgi:hypothetical protein
LAIDNPLIREVNAIEAELTAFRDAILNNQRPPVNEIDGYVALDVAHEILKKIVLGPYSQSNL